MWLLVAWSGVTMAKPLVMLWRKFLFALLLRLVISRSTLWNLLRMESEDLL